MLFAFDTSCFFFFIKNSQFRKDQPIQVFGLMDWIQLRASQARPGEVNEKGRIQMYREVQKWSTSSNNQVLEKLGFIVSLQHPLLHAQETYRFKRCAFSSSSSSPC